MTHPPCATEDVADRSYPRAATISALFSARAAETPDKIAVADGQRSVSYGALEHNAQTLALRLQAAGVGPGDIVAILAQRSVEAVTAMLAVLKLGAIFTPLDPSYPAPRLALMLADAEPKALLVQTGGMDALGALEFPRDRILILDANAGAAENDTFVAPEVSAEDGAYLIYTSGSTGAPKGVLVSHRALIRLVWANRFAGFNKESVVLHVATLSFDASQLEIWGALLNGGTLAIVTDPTPSLDVIADAISAHRATWTLLTTGIFHMIADHRLSALSGLKTIFVGGDVLSAQHVDRAARALPHIQFVNAYGPTENSVVTCCFNVPRTGWTDASVPIGEAIDHTKIYVLDEQLSPVGDGADGELCVGGDGLAIGYHKRPESNAEKFVTLPGSNERLYRTGDIVRRRADGFIDFVGRRDRQVKLNGKRVELDEIECALRADPQIHDAAVILREDNPGVRRLAAYLKARQPHPGPSFERDVLERLRSRVPSHMIPSDVVSLDAFPLTTSGKVDRAALPSPRLSAPQTAEMHNALERQLAEIWCAVLGIDRVGPLDRFVDLGGTSMMLVRVQAMIAEKIAPGIKQSVLFETPTIRQLAERLRLYAQPRAVHAPQREQANRRAAAISRARRAAFVERSRHE